MSDQIDAFILTAIEIAERRLAALEVAKLALGMYAHGEGMGARPAAAALRRIAELEKEI